MPVNLGTNRPCSQALPNKMDGRVDNSLLGEPRIRFFSLSLIHICLSSVVRYIFVTVARDRQKPSALWGLAIMTIHINREAVTSSRRHSTRCINSRRGNGSSYNDIFSGRAITTAAAGRVAGSSICKMPFLYPNESAYKLPSDLSAGRAASPSSRQNAKHTDTGPRQ